MASEVGLPHFLGFDFSTQQIKALIINNALEVLHEANVSFDMELPQFRTCGGVHIAEDQVTVTAPPLLWVKALDVLMEKLQLQGVDFQQIMAISGAGQQHGSVYWKKGSDQTLKSMNPNKFIYEQLLDSFTLRDVPIWQDSSTTCQCRNLEEKCGGAMKLATITGSRAYERFTGNQIAKIFQTKPEVYHATERISLVSSFAASIFLNDYAPIEYSDASGMNLFDINSKEWSDVCLNICAPNLKEKLGDPVKTLAVLGPVGSYFVERYNFSPSCQVVAFTGDNPASLAGLGLRQGDIAVSLGTSDTVYVWLSEPRPSIEGHIFCSPVQDAAYMGLLCFKNGSLTRERIRDDCAEGSWELFNEILDSTPRGNFGNIGMYFDCLEITPAISGDHRFCNGARVARFSPDIEVRAVIEGQFLAKRVHCENMGFHCGPNTRILATGGASANISILQVLADVFNTAVYVQNITNSACLGSAIRAKAGLCGSCYEDLHVTDSFKLAAEPHEDAAEVYSGMTTKYRKLESDICTSAK